MRPSVLLAVAIAIPNAARGDDTVPPPHTAREVDGAPRPGEESGRVDDVTDGDSESTARVVGRGLLFVPKLVFDIATAPVRGAVWANDQLDGGGGGVPGKPHLSIAPVIAYETGFGATLGARVAHPDVFGASERAAVQATIGLGYRARVRGTLDSGSRLGTTKLALDTRYERCPDLAFYGIGNGDRVASATMPIDPRRDSTAIESHYLLQQARVAVVADVAIASALHAGASMALARLDARTSPEAMPIDEVYDPAGLVGFGRTLTEVHPELELRWDDRRPATAWMPKGIHSAGTLARTFAGRVVELDTSAFWHYGAELQHFIRIGGSPRVISARLYGEAVTGSRDEVPFYALPALGGDAYLRGYTFERFRDRIAAFGELQYRWDLSMYATAYLFVDAGRVAHDYGELGVDHLRVGYGAGLALLGGHGRFLAELMLGSSIDGGIVAALSLDPVEDRRRSFR